MSQSSFSFFPAPVLTAILGISAFYHDSAAAIVVDGEIIAAARRLRWGYVGARGLVFSISWCVFQLLLVIPYFGVFTPIGWIMRFLERDPLQLGPNPKVKSFWIPRQITVDPQQYFWQD